MPIDPTTGLPLAVAIVVRRDDGRVLLIKRGPKVAAPGFWTPVTGKVHDDESLVEAGAREVWEEVGLRVEVSPEEIFCSKTANGVWTLRWFLANPSVPRDAWEPLRLEPREVADTRWVRPNEMDEIEPMFDTTLTFFLHHYRGGS